MQAASDNAFQREAFDYEADHEGCGLMLEALQEHLKLVEVRISFTIPSLSTLTV